MANGSRWKKFLLARFACKDLLAYGVCFDNHTFYRPRFIDDNICFGTSLEIHFLKFYSALCLGTIICRFVEFVAAVRFAGTEMTRTDKS